ncbi:TM2 domain-containing protein [Oxalobacteraceae bacterium CAVE-383]|nr:TM2 domain-containing protein [Oxalobacteraceae bacterium CAVE-383]
MSTPHKIKTLATFLAAFFGGIGAHRFYLQGMRDRLGWAHLVTLPISLLLIWMLPEQQRLFTGGLFLISILAGMVEALALGLTPDEKWDARYNSRSGKQSDSGWTVVLLLVFSLTVGATGIIAAMARTFDLLYTGGAYG